MPQGSRSSGAAGNPTFPDVKGLMGALFPGSADRQPADPRSKLSPVRAEQAGQSSAPLGRRAPSATRCLSRPGGAVLTVVTITMACPRWFRAIPGCLLAAVTMVEPFPAPDFIYCRNGYEPGRVYDLLHDHWLPGYGAWTRDLCALRLLVAPCAGLKAATRWPAPWAQPMALASHSLVASFGKYVYRDLNRDEDDRKVFDGLFTVVGSSRRGEFNCALLNHRRNRPGRRATPFRSLYSTETDPNDRQSGDGLLNAARASDSLPKDHRGQFGEWEYPWSGACFSTSTLPAAVTCPFPRMSAPTSFVAPSMRAAAPVRPHAGWLPNGAPAQHDRHQSHAALCAWSISIAGRERTYNHRQVQCQRFQTGRLAKRITRRALHLDPLEPNFRSIFLGSEGWISGRMQAQVSFAIRRSRATTTRCW